MRAVLWFVALFAIAVALALFAGNNQAVVTLFWPPFRVDVSFNLFVLVSVGSVVLLYTALRAVSVLFGLPQRARRWRAQHQERLMYSSLMDAQGHFLAGRFIRASKSAKTVLQQEKYLSASLQKGRSPLGLEAARATQMRVLAHLLLAQSAQALQNKSVRDEHFSQALAACAQRNEYEMREGVQLAAAQCALDDHSPAKALDWLRQLPHGAARRTVALRLKLRAAQQAGRTLQALESTRLLAKHRAFSSLAAQSLVRGLALELIDHAYDGAQLQKVWQSLDASERAMPELVIHAAARLVALGGNVSIARDWLLSVWDRMVRSDGQLGADLRLRFIALLGQVLSDLDAQWLARIEQAQQQQPHDVALQYLAGMACLHRQLWGKAQQLLAQAASGLQDSHLQRQAWRALAELAEQRGDAAGALQAYKRIARS